MKKFLIVLVFVLTTGIFFWVGNESEGELYDVVDPLQPSIAGKVLRFHVLANSDDEVDQAVKLKVRDAIGVYIEPKLTGAGSIEDTERIVNENMEGIIDTAEETLSKNGFDYGVSARITDTDFPVKTYGEYCFPAGKYKALQVTLGEGRGHNWWCVLYPNMCFRGSVYEVVEEDAKEELEEVLSPEEYKDVFQGGKFQIKFKFLEYFK